MKRMVMITGLLLAATVRGPSARADGSVSTADIRERIAAIGIRSVQSASGHIVVSGPDPLGNAFLLSLAEETAVALESLTGLSLPFERQSVRLQVSAVLQEPLDRGVSLTHTLLAGHWIHRVHLADYEMMQTEAAAVVLCSAFLSVYGGTTTGTDAGFALPYWFRRGVVRNMTVAARQETLAGALRLWYQGRLLTPSPILGLEAPPLPEAGLAEDDVLACGALVLWFTSRPSRGSHYASLFRRLSDGGGVDLDWVRSWLPDGADPDEQWDRWLLSQRGVVRGVGTVSLEQFDALYAEWLLYPGRYGIPHDVELPARADCTALTAYRDQQWFTPVMREKRHRIEMLAAGRPKRFQALVGAFVRVLDAIEGGATATETGTLAVAAGRHWRGLREEVRQAGGVLAAP